MNDAWVRRVIQGILIISALLVTAVLAFGVYQGMLVPGSAERGSAEGNSSGAGASSRVGPDRIEGAAFDSSEEYGLLMTAEEGRLLRSVDPRSGEISAEVRLDGTPVAIVPTPGGVSVWITFEGRSEIEIYSTNSLEHEATVMPEGADGRDPEYLTFSETGERLFVTWSGDSSISVYSHEMRELNLSNEFGAEDTDGAVYRNRRATRVYRATDNGSLGVFFARTGQRMGTVDASISQDAPMRFNENRTVLWGVGRDGRVYAVDEAQGVATRWDTRVSNAHAPVILRGSDAPVFVNEESTGLVAMRSWSPDSETEHGPVRSAGTRRLQIDEARGVAGTEILAMETGPGRTLVIVTDAGELVTIDGERFEVLAVRTVGGARGSGQAQSRDGDTGQRSVVGRSAAVDTATRLVSYVVRTEGNFACF